MFAIIVSLTSYFFFLGVAMIYVKPKAVVFIIVCSLPSLVMALKFINVAPHYINGNNCKRIN